MSGCVRCGASLCQNEIGLTMKLISRDAKEFYCMRCLSEKFGVTEERLTEKIEQFKKNGCTLFV